MYHHHKQNPFYYKNNYKFFFSSSFFNQYYQHKTHFTTKTTANFFFLPFFNHSFNKHITTHLSHSPQPHSPSSKRQLQINEGSRVYLETFFNFWKENWNAYACPPHSLFRTLRMLYNYFTSNQYNTIMFAFFYFLIWIFIWIFYLDFIFCLLSLFCTLRMLYNYFTSNQCNHIYFIFLSRFIFWFYLFWIPFGTNQQHNNFNFFSKIYF